MEQNTNSPSDAVSSVQSLDPEYKRLECAAIMARITPRASEALIKPISTEVDFKDLWNAVLDVHQALKIIHPGREAPMPSLYIRDHGSSALFEEISTQCLMYQHVVATQHDDNTTEVILREMMRIRTGMIKRYLDDKMLAHCTSKAPAVRKNEYQALLGDLEKGPLSPFPGFENTGHGTTVAKNPSQLLSALKPARPSEKRPPRRRGSKSAIAHLFPRHLAAHQEQEQEQSEDPAASSSQTAALEAHSDEEASTSANGRSDDEQHQVRPSVLTPMMKAKQPATVGDEPTAPEPSRSSRSMSHSPELLSTSSPIAMEEPTIGGKKRSSDEVQEEHDDEEQHPRPKKVRKQLPAARPSEASRSKKPQLAVKQGAKKAVASSKKAERDSAVPDNSSRSNSEPTAKRKKSDSDARLALEIEELGRPNPQPCDKCRVMKKHYIGFGGKAHPCTIKEGSDRCNHCVRRHSGQSACNAVQQLPQQQQEQ